jgi:hypothetical protein
MREIIFVVVFTLCIVVPLAAQWQEIPGIPQRGQMAYHADLESIVLYDGSGALWRWDGKAWDVISRDGPGVRASAPLVYDQKRNCLVLFGGYDDPVYELLARGIWEWNGNRWIERDYGNKPAARAEHSMVFDAGREVSILYGGDNNQIPIKPVTWAWNGKSWAKLAKKGPSVYGNSMAYDARRNRIVLFHMSGQETWEFDENGWQMVDYEGVAHRVLNMAALGYDAQAGKVFILAQEHWPASDDLIGALWNGKRWRVVKSRGLALDSGSASGASVAYDADTQAIMVYGAPLYTTHRWKDGKWTTWRTVWPLDSYSASLAYDESRDVLVMHTTSATYEWDGSAWREFPLPKELEYLGGKLYYDIHKRILLKGFLPTDDEGSGIGGIWCWNHNHWNQLTVSRRGPRTSNFGMAYDSRRDTLLVFGGETISYVSKSKAWNETWEFNGAYWVRVAKDGPSPRTGISMAYDTLRKRMLLYGGRSDPDGTQLLHDTWEWDGAEWSKVAEDGPGPRAGYSLVYDQRRRMAVLFGGFSSVKGRNLIAERDVWGWDGQVWRRIVLNSQDSPTARTYPAAAYDTRNHRMLLFGGRYQDYRGVAYLNDFWQLP